MGFSGAMDPGDFIRLLDRFALSPEGYRRVRRGVQKRIVRHMRDLQCPCLRAYLEKLDADGDARRDARRLMDVSISRFFRDEPLWKILEEEILPALIREHPGPVRIWSAGCALGQEAYSVALLWLLLTENTQAGPFLELWATDVNGAYLERAIEGLFPAGALARIPAEVRERFFRPAGKKGVRVSGELREGIRWGIHDLAVDEPPSRDFHVVLLRNNLLTYYREETVEAALLEIAGSLRPGGFLAVGRKERLPDFLSAFDAHPAVPYLYRKAGVNMKPRAFAKE